MESQRPWDFTALDRIVDRLWRELSVAVQEVSHPWRTPVLATSSPDGPAARVMVIRSVEPARREWTVFTDARSPKMGEALGNDGSAWVFYDPRHSVQVRARTRLSVHAGDSLGSAAWQQVPEVNRINYRRRVAPGRILDSPSVGWEVGSDEDPHFAILRATVDSLDVLALLPGGQIRAQFRWGEGAVGGGWQGCWVAP